MPYHTVVIPFVEPEFATKWHPTDRTGPFAVLTRGAFVSVREAILWARCHLDGMPYSIQRIESIEE